MPLRSLAALAAVVLFVPASLSQAQELRWKDGQTLTPQRRTRTALVERLSAGATRHVLVRFTQPPAKHERALWSAAGLELGHPLGAGAYFAHVRVDHLDVLAAARLPGLEDVREIETGWKLDSLLTQAEAPPWTIVERAEDGTETLALYVLLQRGARLERGNELLASVDGRVFDVLETVNGLVAFVPRSRVAELASRDEVAWVEAALPQMQGVSFNDSNRALIQADTLQAAPYGLDGSGVTVMVYDAGTARASHMDFGGRLTVRDGSGTISHATHVSGTVGGSGAASAGTFRGMAPGCTIESYGFEYDGNGVFFFTNPGDFENDYDEALNSFGAAIANNSIGTNVEPNGFYCPIQGNYGVLSSLIDGVVGGSLGSPFRIVWANGNERGGSVCDVEGFGDFYSTAPPATAKNHITVGALNSNNDTIASFSSWGPTDDGRLKPDISAPGCQSNGDGGVTSTNSSSDSAYTTFCGTSMAAPTVTGILALVLQDHRAQFGGPDPRNSTLKVLLAQTAVDRGNVGPDYEFGYGSVRGQALVDFMRLGRFLEAEIDEQGSTRRWDVMVTAGTPELELTLAWDDAPAMPNVFGSLVNDLDLVVRDPSGTQHHVWTLDPGNPAAPAVRTGPNRLDNLEQVFVENPSAGQWTVEVRGHAVNEGPQPFSLASSHDLTPGTLVDLSFPNGLPAVLEPGVAATVQVRVGSFNDLVAVGSETLHVRYAAGPFLAFPLVSLGGGLFEATLPPPACSAVPEYFFSATGILSGQVTSPTDAPGSTYTSLVASLSTVLDDDFETDLGWTVASVALTDGPWTRGVPVGGGVRGDPLSDFDGSGSCWLTDNVAGNSDVDGGPTRLTSPLLDLSAGDDFEVSYARWFANDDFDIDTFVVEVSNDGGGSWTVAESVTSGGGGGNWVARSFLVGDFLAPTAQVRLRFSVTDNPNDSVTEAALDAVRVTRRNCTDVPDCNGNGILDSDDIAAGRSLDSNSDGKPDECDRQKHKAAGAPGNGGTVQAP